MDNRQDLLNTKQRIVRYIFQSKETSKTEIALNLAVSMPTVLRITAELVAEGIVREAGIYESTGGRQARKFSINADKNYSVGVDITANHISVVILDLCGNVLVWKRTRERFVNSLEYFEHLTECVDDLLTESKIPDEKVLGVGVSFPGIVDHEKRMLTRSHALGVEAMSLNNVSDLFRFPVLYENDANSAALAEMNHLQGDAIYISLSNTVGGAIILDGKLYRGLNSRSGEFGHMLLKEGRTCYCGKEGCVDAYCCAKVLSDLTDGNLEAFFSGLKQKDSKFTRTWEEYLDNLAILIGNLRMVFDCDVILGGYVGTYMDRYLSVIRKKVLKYNLFDEDVSYIKSCSIKWEAAAVGVAMKFIDRYIMSL